MIGESFEDSVDEDKRLSVDFQANRKWPRNQLCWEAKGPVAKVYAELEPKLYAELNQSRLESSCEVVVSLFMIGKTAKRAKPRILISSTDKHSRKDVKKAIERSGLLDDTFFKLGDLRHPPSGSIDPVAMEVKSAAWLLDLATNCDVLFNPDEKVRAVAMPLLITTDSLNARQVTANAVYNGSQFAYITAAHAFYKSLPDIEDTDDEDDLDVPFDSDDEGGDDDEDRGSDTSPEVTGSEKSFQLSHKALVSHDSSLEAADTDLPLASPALKQIPSQTEPPVNPEDAPDKPAIGRHHRTLGRFYSITTSLDYVVITITDEEVISILQQMKEVSKGPGFTVATPNIKTQSVVAWTVRGPQPGHLHEAAVGMRLTRSDKYVHVHKFTYTDDEGIREGDCGTFVTDEERKVLFGNVIAVSKYNRIAYMTAAYQFTEHLEKIAHWKILTLDTTGMADERTADTRVSPTSPSAKRTKSTTSRPAADEQVVSSSRSPQAKLTWAKPLASKMNDTQDATVNLPESVAMSSARPRRMGTQPISQEGFSISNISLLFQLFAWCIQGYELIADASRLRKDFSILIKLEQEEHRLIGWAKQVRLDYTDENLVLNPRTRFAVINVLDEQRMLLSKFLGLEKKKGLSKPAKPPSRVHSARMEPAMESTKQSSFTMSRVDMNKLNESKAAQMAVIEHEEIKQKALSLVSRMQGSSQRLRRSAYYIDMSRDLVDKLAALNDQMLGTAAQQGSTTAMDSEVAKEPTMKQSPEQRRPRGTKIDMYDVHTLDGKPITGVNQKQKKPTRTVAFYKDTPVWIEWRREEQSPSTHDPGGNRTEERVRNPPATLEMNSNNPHQCCVPHGLGYFYDEKRRRFGLVFEKPSRAKHQAPVALYDLFNGNGGNDDTMPSLTDRIAVMRTLSEAVERLHSVNWLHKDLRSANILFFKDAQSGKTDLESLLVSGLHYFRPTARDHMIERSSDDLKADLYRHPFAQRQSNRSGFKKSHDIYSLGVLLLEIALWKPLDRLLNINLRKIRPETALRIRETLLGNPQWLRKVKFLSGNTVEHVIRICIKGPLAIDIDDDSNKSNDDAEAAFQRAFSKEVVAKLGDIRGL